MAKSSPKDRRIRQLKRRTTLLTRFAEEAIRQRDEARTIATAVIKELENRDKPKDLTITQIPDEGAPIGTETLSGRDDLRPAIFDPTAYPEDAEALRRSETQAGGPEPHNN